MFYVYEWYDVENEEIIYVGKGCGNRYKVRKHNKRFDALIAKVECKSRIIARFATEEEAFDFEEKRIAELTKIGQCKCNIDDGGSGGSVKWWTDEMRKRYSKENVMKQNAQRNRMKAENPMHDRRTAERVGRTKRKPLYVGEKRFDCLKDAMEVYGPKVAYWVKVGHTSTLVPCHYENDEKRPVTAKRNLGGAKRIVYDGVIYECQRDVCKQFGFAPSTLNKYVKRGYTDTGIECRFETESPVREYIPYTNSKPIRIDGIPYESIKEAADKTCLDLRGIKYALKHSGLYKGHNCEYANQQPSLVKSDESSKEGSTTNE